VSTPEEPEKTEAERLSEERQARREERDQRFKNIVLLLLIVVVVYSVIATQLTQRKITDQAAVRDAGDACTSQVLFAAIGTLSDRSEFSTAQASANLKLQQAQADLLRKSVAGKPVTPAEGQEALKNYFTALTEFVTAATEAQNSAKFSPYPTPQQYADCLNAARNGNTHPPLPTPSPSTPEE
jgi:hypothetical protein